MALVGYTNAGKSTLFNRLTGAEVVAKDMLFATLDPTLRTIKLPDGRPAILSDTVGFISDLPHELVEAFRATLEEVQEADVVLHVRDIASADSDAQAEDVEAVLEQLEHARGQDPPHARGLEQDRPARRRGPRGRRGPGRAGAATAGGRRLGRDRGGDRGPAPDHRRPDRRGPRAELTSSPSQGEALAWLYRTAG